MDDGWVERQMLDGWMEGWVALTSNKYPWIQFIIIWVRNSSQVFKNQLIFRFLKNKQN